MGNYNDVHVTRIGVDVSIPEMAYHLIKKLAEVKNKTTEVLIEEYILAGRSLDLEDYPLIREAVFRLPERKVPVRPAGAMEVVK